MQTEDYYCTSDGDTLKGLVPAMLAMALSLQVVDGH